MSCSIKESEELLLQHKSERFKESMFGNILVITAFDYLLKSQSSVSLVPSLSTPYNILRKGIIRFYMIDWEKYLIDAMLAVDSK